MSELFDDGPTELDFVLASVAERWGFCFCREDIPTEDLTLEWESEDTMEMKRAVGQRCRHCAGIREQPEDVEVFGRRSVDVYSREKV